MSAPKQFPTEYTAAMTGEPYLFFEFRQVVKLRLRGFTDEEIKDKVAEENLFQYRTNKRVGRMTATVLKRVHALDEVLLHMCSSGTLRTSRLIALYAIAKTNLLFFEFLEEVFREKVLIGSASLTHKDLRIYFTAKSQHSERVAGWSNQTISKLGQVYLKVLKEANLFAPGEPIAAPLIDPALKEHLAAIGEHRFLSAILGRI